MNNFFSRIQPYAPIVVRLGMSAVFIWFGLSQLIDPAPWTGYVPDAAASLVGGNVTLLVLLNGWFEVVAGLTLALGLQVRLVSFLLGAHLIVISTSLGTSALAIRDYGLSIATLSIVLAGPDIASFDHRSAKRNLPPLPPPTRPFPSQPSRPPHRPDIRVS